MIVLRKKVFTVGANVMEVNPELKKPIEPVNESAVKSEFDSKYQAMMQTSRP